MAISTIHRLDKITGPVALTEITSSKISAGIASMIETPSGHVHPMFRANKDQKPVIEFSTPELETLLTATTGLTGLSISGTPLVSWIKKANATGNIARATTSHSKVTVNLGILHVASISLPHNGRAECRGIVTTSYDGTNDPLVYATSVALSGNITGTEYFCAGPVSVNGTSLPGVKSIEVDCGVDLLHESADGEVWPSFVGIQTVAPTVTIKLFEKVLLNTIGLQGLALNGTTGLVFYARKYANGSPARVANATTQHIKFIGLNGAAIPIDTDAQDSSPYTDTIRFELVAGSDSILPLTVTPSSAIT